MSNRKYLVACMSITEIARITSQLQMLKRRARELEVSDLVHLLGVAELAANEWIRRKLEEMGKSPQC